MYGRFCSYVIISESLISFKFSFGAMGLFALMLFYSIRSLLRSFRHVQHCTQMYYIDNWYWWIEGVL